QLQFHRQKCRGQSAATFHPSTSQDTCVVPPPLQAKVPVACPTMHSENTSRILTNQIPLRQRCFRRLLLASAAKPRRPCVENPQAQLWKHLPESQRSRAP